VRAATKCVLNSITFDFIYIVFLPSSDARNNKKEEYHTSMLSYGFVDEQEFEHGTALQREERVRERE
jgi:hypothetical protein